MDLRFTPEEEAFRREVREFLDRELPSDWMGGPISFGVVDREVEMKWRKMLAEKGWNTMGWPKEYGGQGASLIMQLAFMEEWYYRGAPGIDIFGIELLSPTLMIHGTEKQKREHLGGIARGEVVWCQGYSEPESGSDLASLSTRAVEDGDDYVINGQKIWTSYAQYADWMFILARTDTDASKPKHRGITFFLADMDQPGFTVRPIAEMSGGSSFNEVFFDNVRVPKTNILGEVNRGWYVAMTLLDFERTGIAHPAGGRRILDWLIQYARETKRNGQPLADDPIIRHKLADVAMDLETSRMLAYTIAWMQGQGIVPNREASELRVLSTQTSQKLAGVGMEMLGLGGQLEPGSKWAPLEGFIKHQYLFAVSYTIESGTAEIQRNVIATRGLGLPKSV
ncbi:MAG: acyl-CoA dehydrogenase family protein [Dehalococcoidia bacterium]